MVINENTSNMPLQDNEVFPMFPLKKLILKTLAPANDKILEAVTRTNIYSRREYFESNSLIWHKELSM